MASRLKQIIEHESQYKILRAWSCLWLCWYVLLHIL